MPLTAAVAASQILANVVTALNFARERALRSKDTDLKAIINTLYDEMPALKEALQRLTDENSDLHRKLALKEGTVEPEIRQVGAVNFYFVGEKGPYCQACYDGKGKLSLLNPPQDWNGGIRRFCALCDKSFYEKPMDLDSCYIAPGEKLF